MAVNVFHVEFGINETELTQALELQHYSRAEQLIRNTSSASYLDEGCYQRIPLYISLCGQSIDGVSNIPVNLYIAKLLIEYGANVNLRIPETYYGCEYVGPGKTVLELLVDMYNDVYRHQPLLAYGDKSRLGVLWSPEKGQNNWTTVIGMTNEILTTKEQLQDDILDLIFIILSNGGDPNIRDINQMTPLHNTVILSDNVALARLLCESGADVEAVDIRDNTPLTAMCDAFPFGIRKFVENHPIADPYSKGNNLEDKEEFLEYLLSREENAVNVQGYQGRTALFNCMVRGDMESVIKLLKAGANPCIKGKLKEDKGTIREVSPLLAALASLRVVSSHLLKRLPHLIPKNLQFLAHLVDSGFFSKKEIADELAEYLDEQTDLSHLKRLGIELISRLFGGLSATLYQQCSRVIFQKTVFDKDQFSSESNQYQSQNLHEDVFTDNYIEYLTSQINSQVLESLVVREKLPKDVILSLEIELFRQRLCARVGTYKWFEYYDEELDGWLGYSDSEEESASDEGDSDLEYW
ncbi:uncharacterized protein LOC106165962 [Lingula anatina]|uniref:Uncharacterized protein LOC106165962 n=1 Tax=Lingula anatina TaxID=7574 RepID=A0A1S3IQI5_LINAN|nr:uncharacterized protein LOC106165962 [Lingula anatina]|eukprot:XP_013399804.1 uncharacterized protein LOC106165962 [Lingula anatina]